MRKLAEGDQPQTLQELFKASKEGMMADSVVAQINALLPAMSRRILEEVKAVVSNEIKAQIGAIRVRDGRDGRDGKPGKDADERKIAEKVITELSPQLKKEDLKIDDVKGLRELLDNFSNRITSSLRKKGGGGDTLIADDLSSQANGSTRTFTTTKRIGKALMVVSSQFPTVLRLTTDFTASGTTLTLDSSLTPIASGQTLYFLYAEG